MSEEKQSENDPERTLLTLDQLSQTIEVMTSVVNRLRQHLSEQLQAQAKAQAEAVQLAAANDNAEPQVSNQQREEVQNLGKEKASKENSSKESFVVEIKQQEPDPVRKNSKTLH